MFCLLLYKEPVAVASMVLFVVNRFIVDVRIGKSLFIALLGFALEIVLADVAVQEAFCRRLQASVVRYVMANVSIIKSICR